MVFLSWLFNFCPFNNKLIIKNKLKLKYFLEHNVLLDIDLHNVFMNYKYNMNYLQMKNLQNKLIYLSSSNNFHNHQEIMKLFQEKLLFLIYKLCYKLMQKLMLNVVFLLKMTIHQNMIHTIIILSRKDDLNQYLRKLKFLHNR